MSRLIVCDRCGTAMTPKEEYYALKVAPNPDAVRGHLLYADLCKDCVAALKEFLEEIR